jgi:hypothetical protein
MLGAAPNPALAAWQGCWAGNAPSIRCPQAWGHSSRVKGHFVAAKAAPLTRQAVDARFPRETVALQVFRWYSCASAENLADAASPMMQRRRRR